MDQNVIDVIAWTYSFHLSSMQASERLCETLSFTVNID